MKLIDVLQSENKTIFSRYMELYPSELLNVYDVISDDVIKNLDVLFNGLYSQKTFTPTVEQYKLHNYDSVIDFICFLIHYNCYDKMLNMKKIFNTEYDFMNERTDTTTETTTTKGNTKNNSTMENVENTYGYNSEIAVKDNSTNNTDTNETINNIETTKENTRKYSYKPVQQLIDNEIERKSKEDFTLLTFKTIRNILFIELYE